MGVPWCEWGGGGEGHGPQAPHSYANANNPDEAKGDLKIIICVE